MIIRKIFKAVVLVLRMGPDRIEKLEKEATTDYLTGLLNRRGFEKRVEVEKERSDRYSYPFLVVYIDMDNLKEINDDEGHDAGDDAIIFLAETIKQSCRIMDFAARTGGDEFVIIFPETSESDAEKIVSRLRKKNNISVGYSQYSGKKENLRDVMKLAEKRMYIEKKSKRDLIRNN